MLRLTRPVYLQLVGHCYDGLPLEACGLLGGDAETAKATVWYPTTNAAASSRIYTMLDDEVRAADADADGRGLALIGAVHSHTHTDAYPSPTDVEAAFPGWHYVIVSLKYEAPVLRSYQVDWDGNITEEPVVLDSR